MIARVHHLHVYGLAPRGILPPLAPNIHDMDHFPADRWMVLVVDVLRTYRDDEFG